MSATHPQTSAARLQAVLLGILLACGCGIGGTDDPAPFNSTTETQDAGSSASGTEGANGAASGSGSGSGSVSGNGSDSQGEGPGSWGGSDSQAGGSRSDPYVWSLPPSDTSPMGQDGPAYAHLQAGCEEGAAFVFSDARYEFRSPRNALLFAAGVRLCMGDVAGAKQYLQQARDVYGFEGLAPDHSPECNMFRSVQSVLDQQPRSAYPCPGGEAPAYSVSPLSVIDDPLTFDIDESKDQVTSTSTPGSDRQTPDDPATATLPTTAPRPVAPTPPSSPVPAPPSTQPTTPGPSYAPGQ